MARLAHHLRAGKLHCNRTHLGGEGHGVSRATASGEDFCDGSATKI